MATRRVHPALIVLVVLAAALCAVRGPGRAIVSGGADFSIVYASVGAWLDGADPYDWRDAQAAWEARGNGPRFAPEARGRDNYLYPPSTFALMAPVALLPFTLVNMAWVLVNTASMLVLIGAAASLARLSGNARAMLVALGLAFAPVHTAIFTGQTILPTAALIAGAHALRARTTRDPRGLWSGVMLGLATALKPQIGLPFLAYEAFRVRLGAFGAGLAVALLAAAVGVARLEAAGVDWAGSLGANLASFSTTGEGAYGPEARGRVQMVNLHPVVALAFDDPLAVTAVVWTVVGALAVAALAVWLRVRDEPGELGALSIGAALCLMMVYHRAYDAALLVLPMAWCVARLSRPWLARRGVLPSAVALALVLVYAVPGPALLAMLDRTGRVPEVIAGSAAWRHGALLHHAWLMPVLAGVLIWCLAGGRPRAGRMPRD